MSLTNTAMCATPDRRGRLAPVCPGLRAALQSSTTKTMSVDGTRRMAIIRQSIVSGTVRHEIAFEMATSSIRYGAGVTREVGIDLADLGVKNALVLIDPVVATLPIGDVVRNSLDSAGVKFTVYDRIRVEPTDESFLD